MCNLYKYRYKRDTQPLQFRREMADNTATSQEDDLCLPRAAVNKMIKETIPMIRVSNDARELLLNCCTEFIHLIASEANDICNQQTKKTISPEHVIAALESLGFHDYVEDVEGVYQQFKTQAQTRKKSLKMKNQGISEEELLRQQQALISQARAAQAQEEWMHLQQQQTLLPQQYSNSSTSPHIQPSNISMQPIPPTNLPPSSSIQSAIPSGATHSLLTASESDTKNINTTLKNAHSLTVDTSKTNNCVGVISSPSNVSPLIPNVDKQVNST